MGVGARHRGLRARSRPALGHGARHRRRGREDLDRRRRPPRRSGSSAWATTTSGAWATPARAARRRRSSTTSVPSSGPTAARPRARTATSRSGTSCSCSSTRSPTATLLPLPKPSIDTGAGLERNLTVLQGVASAWETDLLLPARRGRGRARPVSPYGGFPGGERDLWLRILADHGRTMTFLVADGVVPSNEGRGYVLRRDHPARGAARVPARRRAATWSRPRWSTRPST